MIRGLKNLMDVPVMAEDGELGGIHELYFDADMWVLRYIAIELDDNNSVLLSPLAFTRMEKDAAGYKVNLTREVVLNSPQFDLTQPVTRVQETDLHNYFSWPFYWLAGGLASYPLIELASEMKENESAGMEDDPNAEHLRRLSLILGSHIQARNGEIGSVEDMLVDEESWNILYLIVDTGAWMPGRIVLLSPSWVEDVDWATGEITMDLNKETIEKSPEYDPDVPIDEDFDKRLREHYRS
jgi:hypothetical protein